MIQHHGRYLNTATLDNLLEGFLLISPTWRYVYLNKAALAHSRYTTAEELIGYTMMEKFPGIENTSLFAELEICMKERSVRKIESEFTYQDGSVGHFEFRVEPVPEGLFILSVDITEKKKAETERQQYLKDLEEMLFITSHRVRQPVANILGVSGLLSGNKHEENDLKKIAEYMKRSAVDLDAFTSEITNFLMEKKISRSA
jgi:PAS domain S-box-containing protein